MFQIFFFIILASVVSFSVVNPKLKADVSLQLDAVDATSIVQKELPVLQRSYQHLVSAQEGYAPPVTAAPDGGFSEVFSPLLKLLPATPPGFAWSYHRYPDDASPWAGMNYVCLKGDGPSSRVSFRGLVNASSGFHPGRYFVSEACGSTASLPSTAEQQRYAVTFFLAYTPPEVAVEPEVGSVDAVAEEPAAPSKPGRGQGADNAAAAANGRGTPWADWECPPKARHCRDK